MSSDTPYSYHTFIFPFIWNESVNNNNSGKSGFDLCAALLEHNEYWEHVDLSELVKKNLAILDGVKQAEQTDSADRRHYHEDQYRCTYGAYQYFTDAARSIIFDTDNCPSSRRSDAGNIAANFYLKYSGKTIQNKSRILIRKDLKDLILNVNSIRLKVFKVGIAVMIFELEYYGEGKGFDNMRSADAVNCINEYGRRISLPFITSDGNCSLTADEICFIPANDTGAEDDETDSKMGVIRAQLGQKAAGLANADDKDGAETFIANANKLSWTDVSELVTSLLSLGMGRKSFTSDRFMAAEDKDKIYIRPIIDDRMFVCCVVMDDELCAMAKQYDSKKGEYKIFTDTSSTGVNNNNSLSEIFYKLAFVETSCTCPGVTMRSELLRRCVYKRWIDYGTLQAVTHHSMVTVTSPCTYNEVTLPFLTQYVEMAVIVLVQRAVITNMSNRAAKIAKGFNSDGRINSAQRSEISALHEEYVSVQNQLLLSSVTMQEQGVEIFEMLRNEMYIDKNQTALEDQLHNLYEIANINSDRELNFWVTMLTIAGVLIGIIQIVTSIFDFTVCPLCNKIFCSAVSVAIIIVPCVIFSLIRKKRSIK